MGGALQAIARSSPARGARMDGREGREEGNREAQGKEGRGNGQGEVTGKVKGRD